MKYNLSASEMRTLIREKLSHNFGVSPAEATNEHFYKALVLILNDLMAQGRKEFMEKAEAQNTKQVFYLCMEFLMGRSLKNTLHNLGLTKTAESALEDFDIKLDKIFDQEPDAGLGNGGLGRLAACFLDALATDGYPAKGYSLRYDYGIFRQKLVDGWQTELPDSWLPGGEIWFNAHPDEAVEVRFDGNIRDWWDGPYHHVEHENYSPVTAVPYDLMVAGQDGKGISVLRLWSAKYTGFDMAKFNQGDYMKALEQTAMAEVITKVLYPADNHYEGKSLRLRQQYFLVSASIQDIVHNHLARFGTVENLPEKIAIHTNDTHPVLAIPELMRILLDECGYSWDAAWDIVTRTIAYTNHTVMSEALECWSVSLFRDRLPRIFQIVTEIDNRHRHNVWEMSHDAGLVERTAIISGDSVRMANLAVAACHHVNGVSKLHSDLLTETIFKDFYRLTPQKFTNVTNGIAMRRWLNQANPELAAFITELIGNDYVYDYEKLSKLNEFKDDESVLKRLAEIKRNNKIRLAKYIEKHNGIVCNPDSIFDIQIKRLHEYKRQQLNALKILSDYLWLKQNPNAPFVPKTYIFGAKAASGYYMAKQIIQFICSLSEMIERDTEIADKLKVVFVEDYRVTLAELLVPAAEISEQISLAGTEASGTGNMKLMLNGAITLGTEDGANVEIHQAVGDDNIFIFGMDAQEVEALKPTYSPQTYYHNNPRIKSAIDFMRHGINGNNFDGIINSLVSHDPYMVLADFESYCRARDKVDETYLNPSLFNKMSLANIANSGRFSADRSIHDYARDIWDAKPVNFKVK